MSYRVLTFDTRTGDSWVVKDIGPPKKGDQYILGYSVYRILSVVNRGNDEYCARVTEVKRYG